VAHRTDWAEYWSANAVLRGQRGKHCRQSAKYNEYGLTASSLIIRAERSSRAVFEEALASVSEQEQWDKI
jgi:hypothetical protein